MRIVSLGHMLFALVMIAVGVMGFMSGDFAPIWQQMAKTHPERDLLVQLTAIIALAGGIGLLLKPTAWLAAPLLFLALLADMLRYKIPFILKSPFEAVAYETNAETAVLVAAAWMLWTWFAGDTEKRTLSVVAGDTGASAARILYGIALVIFGIAHFAYLQLTASLVPNWLGAHEAWATLTGFTYAAAGAAILSGVFARLAAALVTLQIALFTLLIWVPVVMAGHIEPQAWTEFVVSCALTAAALVMAESYGRAPWLAISPRLAEA